MRKVLIIFFLLTSFLVGYSQQTEWVSHNDSLFMKRGNDSVYYNQYMFFDYFIYVKSQLIGTKQPLLISGTNIKTINGSSVLGSGDIVIAGGLAPNGNGSLLTGLTATQVGLGSVDNTSDINKPVSTPQQTALNLKANITTIGVPIYARVTGSNATTTGQALVDIAGLTAALVANAVYEFSANLSVSTTSVTTGTQYGVQYSAAGAAVVGTISGSSTSAATKTERVTTLNTASTAYLTTSAQSGGVTIRGIVTTGANPGNLTIKHLKVTSGTSTVFTQSFLKVTRIQ